MFELGTLDASPEENEEFEDIDSFHKIDLDNSVQFEVCASSPLHVT
jgi:hypothetical protein